MHHWPGIEQEPQRCLTTSSVEALCRHPLPDLRSKTFAGAGAQPSNPLIASDTEA